MTFCLMLAHGSWSLVWMHLLYETHMLQTCSLLSFKWGWSLKFSGWSWPFAKSGPFHHFTLWFGACSNFRHETSWHWLRESGGFWQYPKHDQPDDPSQHANDSHPRKQTVFGAFSTDLSVRFMTFFVRWYSWRDVAPSWLTVTWGESCAFSALQTRRIGMEARNWRMAFQWRGVLYSF